MRRCAGPGPEVRLLIKGSRFNRLERVVDALTGHCAGERSLMLYWITQQFAGRVSGLHVFSYLTFRAILATASALGLSLLVGPSMIARLSRYQIGQVVRDDGPPTHLPKAGTPDDGRHAHPRHHAREHAAVGGAVQPPGVDGARASPSPSVSSASTTTT